MALAKPLGQREEEEKEKKKRERNQENNETDRKRKVSSKGPLVAWRLSIHANDRQQHVCTRVCVCMSVSKQKNKKKKTLLKHSWVICAFAFYGVCV